MQGYLSKTTNLELKWHLKTFGNTAETPRTVWLATGL